MMFLLSHQKSNHVESKPTTCKKFNSSLMRSSRKNPARPYRCDVSSRLPHSIISIVKSGSLPQILKKMDFLLCSFFRYFFDCFPRSGGFLDRRIFRSCCSCRRPGAPFRCISTPPTERNPTSATSYEFDEKELVVVLLHVSIGSSL